MQGDVDVAGARPFDDRRLGVADAQLACPPPALGPASSYNLTLPTKMVGVSQRGGG